MVETTLDLIEAKKCGLCYEWLDVAEMQWDAEPYCYVCKDGEKCAARRPGAQGKRARRTGSYSCMRTCLASMLSLHACILLLLCGPLFAMCVV